MKSLSTDQVLLIHDAVIVRYGGEAGVRDLGMLESALARPFAEFEGVEAHPEVHAKAAALLQGLASNHPFVDGNKRVTLAAMLVFLRINGYGLSLSLDQRYDLTMRVSDGSLSFENISRLLRDVIL